MLHTLFSSQALYINLINSPNNHLSPWPLLGNRLVLEPWHMLQDRMNFDVKKSAPNLTSLLRLFILITYSFNIKLSSCWLAKLVSMTYPGRFLINHHSMAWLACPVPAPKDDFRIAARVWRAPMIVAQIAKKVCSRSRRHCVASVATRGIPLSVPATAWLGACIPPRAHLIKS